MNLGRKSVALGIVIVAETAIGLFGTIPGIFNPDARYLIPGALLRMILVDGLVVLGLGKRKWPLWVVAVIESISAISCLWCVIWLIFINRDADRGVAIAGFSCVCVGFALLTALTLAAIGKSAILG